MAKKRTATEKVRGNPKNVSAKELMEVLEENGYVLRNIAGDHYVYKKDGSRPIPVPFGQNPLALRIVKNALSMIDALDAETGEG